MRIGIDARLAVGRRMGIGKHTLHLVRHLLELDRSNEYLLYLSQPDLEGVLPTAPNCRQVVLSPAFYPLWEQVALPRAARRDRLDALHCTLNTGPVRPPHGLKLVVTLHDVIYLLPRDIMPPSPSRYQRLGARYRAWVTRALAKRADLIITSSRHSRSDLLRLAGAPPERVEVVYPGMDPAWGRDLLSNNAQQVSRRYGASAEYVLCLGGVHPRKNTERAIRAFMAAQRRRGGSEQLIVVGLERPPLEGGRVIFVGYLPDAELAALYAGAKVFLYPSLYEGFGFPPLEAMAMGTPVICSDTSSLPEVVGDAAVQVDPRDEEAISRAIADLLSSPDRRAALVAAGYRQVKRFSWQSCARRTLELYLEK
jgi:glycosyltransferase involved in cell wall biosynthesis